VTHWGFAQSCELKKMTVDDYIMYGGYPGSYRFISDKKRWINYMTQSIVETVITKDILTQANVKSPALFRQSFYMFASVPAQVVSYHKLLGQLQDKGNIDLIKYYLNLFENAFLIRTIQKYSKNEIRKKASSPKIIVMSPALSSFHRLDNLDQTAKGRIFESMVGAELIRENFEPFYWAEGDYEVDYILEYKQKIIAIEVKSGSHKKANSLQKFLQKYPEAHPIFITKENFGSFSKDITGFLDKLI
jgi:predicted AAA+ superfamily ATPase